jgi:hypothetical protein
MKAIWKCFMCPLLFFQHIFTLSGKKEGHMAYALPELSNFNKCFYPLLLMGLTSLFMAFLGSSKTFLQNAIVLLYCTKVMSPNRLLTHECSKGHKIRTRLYGAILHGHFMHCYTFTANMSGGSNVSIEIIHRTLMLYLREGKKLPPTLFIQLDNTCK